MTNHFGNLSFISNIPLLSWTGEIMKKFLSGLIIITGLVTLAGCHHESPAVGHDGRPHAPSGESVPGGPLGKGPVGQPQS